jgi:hypothetical protein
MHCGELYIVTTFHNPKKRGKRTFTLSVRHAQPIHVQQFIGDIDPRDQYELTYTTHECEFTTK